MTRIHQGIFGAIAVLVGFGAVGFAAGSDLDIQRIGDQPQSVESAVNRASKSDRAMTSKIVAEGRTIAVQLNDQSSSSILVRIPQTGEARRAPSNLLVPNASRKTVVACEPVVSVLTDIAKLLQPGRCVT